MDLVHDDATRRMGDALRRFLDRSVVPAEPVYREQLAAQDDPWHWTAPPVLGELRAEARELGLWNLFLPGDEGAGLTRSQYLPLAELTRRSPLGPVAVNGSAPDTGVMLLLAELGTAEQKQRWLRPLLDGRIRSCLAVSDAGTSIVRDGDELVVTGRQSSVVGALNPDATIFVVTGRTSPAAEPGRRLGQVLVPRSADGLSIRRSTHVVGGREGREPGGLATLDLAEVRVPVWHLLGEEGDGSAITRTPRGLHRPRHRTG